MAGAAYVLNTFVAYLAPAAEPVAALLLIPATTGEFWPIGWLLWHAVRTHAVRTHAVAEESVDGLVVDQEVASTSRRPQSRM